MHLMNKLLLFGLLLGGAALIAGCIQVQSSASTLVVNVKRDGDGCHVSVNGERVTSDRLLEIGRNGRNRRAIVVFDKDTPYKCIGGAIFTLQRAGIPFVEPALWEGS